MLMVKDHNQHGMIQNFTKLINFWFYFWILTRWVESWSSQITTGLAIFLVICGIITAISPINYGCILPGVLQLYVCFLSLSKSFSIFINHFHLIWFRIASGIILSIEAPSFVPFLAFARSIGMFVESKPYWFKGAFYAA